MNAAQRQRKNRQLELHSMASIQNIRESLRESAISTKCALLEPSIRTYGSPKTRRKIDVEADHLIALQCMSPYPKSKLDLLDDLEDIHTNVPLSNSTSQLQSRISLDRNNDKQRQWGTSVRALREHETKEEQHHRQQLEMDAQSKHSPQAPLQHRIEYSSYTQSLIERTHSRLYDEPKYISMTKRGKCSKRRRSNVAVIFIKIVFIGLFLFYCLLLNHSFQKNPNKITNCFELFSYHNLQLHYSCVAF